MTEQEAPCQVCLGKVELYEPTIERLRDLAGSTQKRLVLRRTLEAVEYWKRRSLLSHHHNAEDF